MSAAIRRTVTILFLLGVATVPGAQEAPPVARYIPSVPDPAHVFVLDSAHVLSAATVSALQDSARALQAETKADVAWVTLPTLGGRAIEEAALFIGRTWRIGTPGQPGDPLRNHGLVVLYVPDKTTTAGSNFRVEVGNGLEGTITDSRSRTISAAMRDDLKAKRYDAAYMKGWAVAAALVREDFASRGVRAVAPLVPTPPLEPNFTPTAHESVSVIPVALASLAVVFVLVMLIRAGRGRRSGGTGGMPMFVNPGSTDIDDEARRRSAWSPPIDTSSSSGGDSGGSSGGGDFGGGGGFSGGGSSDTI